MALRREDAGEHQEAVDGDQGRDAGDHHVGVARLDVSGLVGLPDLGTRKHRHDG